MILSKITRVGYENAPFVKGQLVYESENGKEYMATIAMNAISPYKIMFAVSRPFSVSRFLINTEINTHAPSMPQDVHWLALYQSSWSGSITETFFETDSNITYIEKVKDKARQDWKMRNSIRKVFFGLLGIVGLYQSEGGSTTFYETHEESYPMKGNLNLLNNHRRPKKRMWNIAMLDKPMASCDIDSGSRYFIESPIKAPVGTAARIAE